MRVYTSSPSSAAPERPPQQLLQAPIGAARLCLGSSSLPLRAWLGVSPALGCFRHVTSAPLLFLCALGWASFTCFGCFRHVTPCSARTAPLALRKGKELTKPGWASDRHSTHTHPQPETQQQQEADKKHRSKQEAPHGAMVPG